MMFRLNSGVVKFLKQEAKSHRREREESEVGSALRHQLSPRRRVEWNLSCRTYR